jgi:hypothetical protein
MADFVAPMTAQIADPVSDPALAPTDDSGAAPGATEPFDAFAPSIAPAAKLVRISQVPGSVSMPSKARDDSRSPSFPRSIPSEQTR